MQTQFLIKPALVFSCFSCKAWYSLEGHLNGIMLSSWLASDDANAGFQENATKSISITRCIMSFSCYFFLSRITSHIWIIDNYYVWHSCCGDGYQTVGFKTIIWSQDKFILRDFCLLFVSSQVVFCSELHSLSYFRKTAQFSYFILQDQLIKWLFLVAFL